MDDSHLQAWVFLEGVWDVTEAVEEVEEEWGSLKREY